MHRSYRPIGRRALVLLAAAICCGSGGRLVEALSCMCHGLSRCEKPTNCSAGVALDACSCCYECARTANETCGGLFHLHGTCANGLYCETAPERADDGSVAAAPAEVQPGICVPCRGPTRYGCDAIEGQECQCGKSCTKEFRFDSLEACRSALHSRRPGLQPLASQLSDGSERGATPATHESMQDFPSDETSCLDVTCPDDRDLFVECPADSWRRPLPEPALFEICCGIHGMTDECVCKEPHSCPAPPMCDEGLVPIEVITADGKPGSCCSLYQCTNVTSLQCEFKGTRYEHGEEVPPASLAASAGGSGTGSSATGAADAPACQSCFCLEAQVLCQQKVECPPVPSTCSWMAVADGECCPTCRGCVSQSTLAFHAVGESWQEDDCTSCECDVDGVPRCFAGACAAPRCARPLKVPGHCCPVCSADFHGATSAAAVDDGGRIDVVTFGGSDNSSSGTTLTSMAVPAATSAADGTVVAVPAATQPPSAAAAASCRPLDCARACGEASGDLQQPDSAGCPTCQCASTSAETLLPTTPSSAEPNRAAHGGTTLQDSTTVKVGAAVTDSNGSQCFTSLGRPRQHGETWFDGCRECMCDNGRELCSLVACPQPLCRHPVISAGQCCPVCPENGYQQLARATNITSGCHSPAVGFRRRVGASSTPLGDGGEALEESREPWRLDACSVCICHQGHALCETERCPPILCEKPVYVTGHCCPTCPDAQYWPASITALPSYKQGCTALGGGRTYRHGDVWRASDCQSCTCQHGQLHCYSQTCPAAVGGTGIAAGGGGSCASAVSRKGQCCPICTADPADVHHRACIISDQVFLHGQEWTMGCLLCVCYHGTRHCAPRPCSQLRFQTIACRSSFSVPLTATDPLQTDAICCQHCLDSTERDGSRERAGPYSPGGGSGGEMAVMATLAALLCLFAVVIVVLVIVVVRRTRRRSGSATLGSVVPELLGLTGGGGGGAGSGGAGGIEMLSINNRPAGDSGTAALRAASVGGGGGIAGMKRPKSTNLEFYVGSFRYNNTSLKDKECCKPLVDGGGGSGGGSSSSSGRTHNEYVLC